MKTNNSILGLLGGIGIGVALGVLFAPDKGTETRRKIGEKGTDLTDELKSKFEDIMKLLENIVSASENKGKEYLNDGKSLLEQINKDVVNEFK
ncbi:MAG: YtxH domain-containing protein [Flavobacterium sp.]|nr:YtxH domain-containing protein [Flavobacterium sp.]